MDAQFTQNAQVKSAILFGFLDDCRQGVRKVLEQSVLLLDRHSQNTIEELPDVVVVWGGKWVHLINTQAGRAQSQKVVLVIVLITFIQCQYARPVLHIYEANTY